MSIKFRERPTMEHAFQLEVRKSIAVHSGQPDALEIAVDLPEMVQLATN
jgi:hypothetical protein